MNKIRQRFLVSALQKRGTRTRRPSNPKKLQLGLSTIDSRTFSFSHNDTHFAMQFAEELLTDPKNWPFLEESALIDILQSGMLDIPEAEIFSSVVKWARWTVARKHGGHVKPTDARVCLIGLKLMWINGMIGQEVVGEGHT